MLYQEDEGKVTGPKYIAVGKSALDGGTIVIGSPRKNAQNEEHFDNDTLQGADFRAINGVINGKATILYHGLTVPGNICFLKKLVRLTKRGCTRRVMRNFLRDSEIGTIDRLRQLCQDSVDAELSGLAPVVLARASPLPFQARNRPGTDWEDMTKNEGPTNRRFSEREPVGAPFWSVLSANRGFLATIPHLLIMDQTQSLVDELSKLAKDNKNDVILPYAAILACFVWVDLMDCPERGREPFCPADGIASVRGLPNVSLATFIVYFPYWLREHCENGLLYLTHPFRAIHAWYIADIANDSAFEINPKSIAVNTVREAVMAATSSRRPSSQLQCLAPI